MNCSITIIKLTILVLYFYSKSENVKNESEEETDDKNDIVVGVSTPKVVQKVKRKLSINDDQNKKVKSSLKKKSLSQNWKVSDDI